MNEVWPELPQALAQDPLITHDRKPQLNPLNRPIDLCKQHLPDRQRSTWPSTFTKRTQCFWKWQCLASYLQSRNAREEWAIFPRYYVKQPRGLRVLQGTNHIQQYRFCPTPLR